ncbi:MAG TPA: protein tyrosine phosphatase, partial [Dehalococcoidia bacterium]|nr:protein tyrosine phosphatase [Dehalococcoidia bacterium]
MPADIYWIGDVGTGRLAILGRPRPGDWLEDEIGDWRRQGIDVAVSLLEPSEASTLGLDEEPTLCQRNE